MLWSDLINPNHLQLRANVRLDRKDFTSAIADYDRSIALMKEDGENEKGLGRYPEYADTFVGMK